MTSTQKLVDEILNSDEKLRKFHQDWNKLLESDEEDETESLVDDFSSSLRCSEYDEQHYSENLDTIPEKDELVSTKGEIDEASDSGLGIYSSSSHLDEVDIVRVQSPIEIAQIASNEQHKQPSVSNLHEFSNEIYYGNYNSNMKQVTDQPIPINHKRNYDEFKHPDQNTPQKTYIKPDCTGSADKNDDGIFRKPISSPSLSRSSSRSSIRSTSTNSEPPTKRRFGKSAIEYETDQTVIQRRQKQIDYGKNTIGYQTYQKTIPKSRRTRENPITPDKFVKYSRRSWDQQVKIWRRKIHQYDPLDVIHYQSSKLDSNDSGSDHIREVKKHLNFDQAATSSSSTLKRPQEYKETDEVAFDDIDASGILDAEDFML